MVYLTDKEYNAMVKMLENNEEIIYRQGKIINKQEDLIKYQVKMINKQRVAISLIKDMIESE